jgi:hypothetical protein
LTFLLINGIDEEGVWELEIMAAVGKQLLGIGSEMGLLLSRTLGTQNE